MTEEPKTVDYEQQFRENNIQTALGMIRNLSIHCVMFVPANSTPENAKALIHRHLMTIVKLYEPKAAEL